MELAFFRAGRCVDSQGTTHHFSVDDINQIALDYNPLLRAAPLILTHSPLVEAIALSEKVPEEISQLAELMETLKEFSYGMVKRVFAKGDTLFAEVNPVSPKFRELAANGELLGLSASFFGKNSPGNPKQGGKYLKHIAALGKTPPAIPNLLPLPLYQFSDSLEGVISIDFVGFEEDINGMNENALKQQNERLQKALTRLPEIGIISQKLLAFSAEAISFSAAEEFKTQPPVAQWLLSLDDNQYQFAISLINQITSNLQQPSNNAVANSSFSLGYSLATAAIPQPGSANSNSLYSPSSLQAETRIEAAAKSRGISFREAARQLGYV